MIWEAKAKEQLCFIVLSYVYCEQPILGLIQEWFIELSFTRQECGLHDRLHIHPLWAIFYFPWQSGIDTR